MKTKLSLLFPAWVRTESSHISWYKDGQMMWYTELKNGKRHGECKGWHLDGQLEWLEVYEDGNFAKQIV